MASPLAGFSFIRLSENTVLKSFDCGDSDLNDFFINKAKYYSKELLAKTYILESEEKTIAYLSIYNDSLSVQEQNFASKTKFRRWLSELVEHPKRHLRNFPAIKIGRLAVCSETKLVTKGIGTALINFVFDLALEQNEKCACQLVTVDAYDESLKFYEKLGFRYLTESDEGKDTRQMFFDLRILIP